MKPSTIEFRDHPLGWRLKVAVYCSLSLLCGTPVSQTAIAQERSKLILRLSPTIQAEPNRETKLPVAIEPADAAPPKSFLRIRGLPPTVALSDGYSLGPGFWAVPLRSIPELRVVVPAGTSQRSEVLFTLVNLDGATLAEASTLLVIGPTAKATEQSPTAPTTVENPARASVARSMTGLGGPPPSAAPPASAPVVAAPPPTIAAPPSLATPSAPPATSAPVVVPIPEARLPRTAGLIPPAAQPPQPPPPLVPNASPEERQRIQRWIDRGDEQLAEGSVAAARLLYTRAAEAGHAQGALALGSTFDPNELARLKVVGIRPEIETARQWYRKAQTLGAPQAAERLRRLEGR